MFFKKKPSPPPQDDAPIGGIVPRPPQPSNSPPPTTGGIVPRSQGSATTSAASSNAGVVTLASNVVHPLFGKVSYVPRGEQLEVTFTILMQAGGEGWQTGVALDASSSMRLAYGRSLEGQVPPAARGDYQKRGWVREEDRDGRSYPIFSTQACEDAISKGYLRWTPNTVEAEARQFIQYLADNIDADGGTTAIYWACGRGEALEVIGDVRGDEVAALSVRGPQSQPFGVATHLLPAVKYFEQRFDDAANGMYVFITDGRIDDLEAVKSYCRDLARRVQSKARLPLKFVLIGMGSEIDTRQMEELDNLETGTDVDLWDAKIARDMREVTEIFAEIVDESLQLAPMATIYDANGNLAKRFSDGLPPRVSFSMPASSAFFELELPGQDRIRQPLR